MKEGEEPLFCVYDQTVPRKDPELPQVATHAGIFLRHFPAPRTANRNQLIKDLAGELRKKFEATRIDVANYRGGIFVEVNNRARLGM